MELKKLTTGFVAVAMALTAVATPLGDNMPVISNSSAVIAGAETYGDYEYSVLDDKTIEIIDYTGYGKRLAIPAKIDGKKVTSIGNFAFSSNRTLTSITLPEGVNNIGEGAFLSCTSLSDVKLPKTLKTIGNSAFFSTAIYKIDIYNNVKSIGRNAFAFTNLSSVELPDSIVKIESSTFAGNYNLSSVKLPYSIKYIGEEAFCDCEKLKTITIPGNVEKIEAHAIGFETVYDDDDWYDLDEIEPTYKVYSDFSIKCYKNTAGEKYAKDNKIKYTLLEIKKPSDIKNFRCTAKASTSISLAWSKNSTAGGYEIEQYKDGKWVNVAKITGNATTSYTVKGLAAGTAGYQFRIRAYRTEGKNKAYSGYSSIVKVNTNPYGVGGFKCSSKTSTSVTLKWNKGTTASGYQLQQYKDGKWVTIYTGTKATSTSYTVKGLKAGTAGYRFRIRAYKTYGNTKQYGSWSSEVKVNTNPYGVGGFKVKATTKTSITLGWNKGTTASGYQLQQYKGGKWVTVYTGTKATSTSYTVKSLKANTSYKFRIRAYKTYGNAKQYGSWSKELTVRTKR